MSKAHYSSSRGENSQEADVSFVSPLSSAFVIGAVHGCISSGIGRAAALTGPHGLLTSLGFNCIVDHFSVIELCPAVQGNRLSLFGVFASVNDIMFCCTPAFLLSDFADDQSTLENHSIFARCDAIR